MAEALGRARRGTRLLVAASVGLAALLAAAPAATAQDDPYGGTTTTTEAPGARVSCSLSSSRARVGSTVGGHLSGTRVADRHRIFVGEELVAEVVPTGPETDFGFTVPDMQPGRYTVTAVGATATAECTVPGGGTRFQVLPRTGGGNGGSDRGVLGAGASAGDGASTAVRSRSLATTGLQVLALVVIGVGLVAAGLVLRNRARLRRAGARH